MVQQEVLDCRQVAAACPPGHDELQAHNSCEGGVAVRLGSHGLLGRLAVLGRSSVSAGGGGAQLRAPPAVPTLHVQVNKVVVTKLNSHSHSCSDRIAVKSQYTFYTKPCSAHSLSKHKTLPLLLGSARPGTRMQVGVQVGVSPPPCYLRGYVPQIRARCRDDVLAAHPPKFKELVQKRNVHRSSGCTRGYRQGSSRDSIAKLAALRW